MAPRGIIIPLSVSKEDFSMPYSPLLSKGLRIQGSLVASRNTHRQMIAFAARHNIKPMLTKFPLSLDGLKQAFTALEGGKMRYRGVLTASSPTSRI
jgi:D-arabinose 1-dehydrogenase-like Zn-dependent alcohol dehydrogenase